MVAAGRLRPRLGRHRSQQLVAMKLLLLMLLLLVMLLLVLVLRLRPLRGR